MLGELQMENLLKKRPFSAKNLFLVITLLPIVVYWAFFNVIDKGPFYMRYDPESLLFDSLAIFKGIPYSYVDHPGTPVTLLGSLFFGITYPFLALRGDNFFLTHLFHPDYFFQIAYIFTLGLTLVSATSFYKISNKLLGNGAFLISSALALFYFVLHPMAFISISFWSHNAFNYFLGTLLLIWLFSLVIDDKPISKKRLIVLGFCYGLLSTVQLYMIAWPIGAIFSIFLYHKFILSNWKESFIKTLQFLGGVLLGVFVFMLPAVKSWEKFAKWIIGIATHQGRYG